ncbi:MAG: DNA helicase-2/ATP-dependent DNA helicase PcrA, partial [Pseudoalteromonas distincta]|uniref:3'-5' exonuclease n=1 Tax=Pseudoalteromonas distincta TaxID=77608 RepID=UPI0039E3746F
TTQRELDEERNNAFVAVTRAKRWLYISYPQNRLMPWGSEKFHYISRFLNNVSVNSMIHE